MLHKRHVHLNGFFEKKNLLHLSFTLLRQIVGHLHNIRAVKKYHIYDKVIANIDGLILCRGSGCKNDLLHAALKNIDRNPLTQNIESM